MFRSYLREITYYLDGIIIKNGILLFLFTKILLSITEQKSCGRDRVHGFFVFSNFLLTNVYQCVIVLIA